MKCPLCKGRDCKTVASDKRREFVQCGHCLLVFVPTRYHLTIDNERARYALHDNTLANAGYVQYLEKVIVEIEKLNKKDALVLDYGCGQQAVLTALLGERGYECVPFDPLYNFAESKYYGNALFDIVVVCEVIEHCRNVNDTVMDIKSKLAEEAVVLIRTQCYPGSVAAITNWWYAQDVTHITFFSKYTLRVVADLLGKQLVDTDQNDLFMVVNDCK